MRIWAKKLMDNPPQDKKDMTKKDRWLVFLSALFDATMIGLLVYVLMVNSCQICYQTGFGQNTFQKCKGISDVMETGLPQEIVTVYEGQEAYEDRSFGDIAVEIADNRIDTPLQEMNTQLQEEG